MAGYRLTEREDRDRSSHPIVPVRLGLPSSGVIQQNNTCSMQGFAVQSNFFTPQLARFPVNENTLFQQGGATSHTARMSVNAVNALFPKRVVSRNGDNPWPSRSPDLTLWDYFLWGYLKTKVFETRPRTIAYLKQRIQDEVAAFPVEMLRQVMNSSRTRTRGMRVSKRKPSWGRYFQNKFSNWHKTKWLFICFSFMTNKQIKNSCVDLF